ncbi:hypothetical protein M747DRAFT_233967 [Aspergillus niger ATCC 13496]|uniref:Contig An15c0250, genomic contig n=3 Tax=Aspergillus niger TaxID=5061 RepID=A2R6F6_ASPNC|nr:uncharacterized protein An15g07770 [Aspergillus niger]RDH22093.1 hypothetical protein M747DRAFT_233967 [Aspergillus niger ATCC 13496]CAK42664.1 unnamed protein product [Aspergillus niger]
MEDGLSLVVQPGQGENIISDVAVRSTVMYDIGSTDLVSPMRYCVDRGSHALFEPAGSRTFSRKIDVKLVGVNSAVTPSVSGNSPHREVESSSAPIFQRRSQIHPWKASWGWELLHGLPMMGFLHSGRCIIADSWPEPVFPFYFVPGSEYRAELTLGGVDKSKFIGDLIWTDLNRNVSILSGAYTWASTGIAGGPPALFVAGLTALGTGTAILQIPDKELTEDLYRQILPFITMIDSAGAWGAPCPLLDAVAPELTFTIGTDSQSITLPRNLLNLGEYPGQPENCQAVLTAPRSPLRIRWEKGAPCGWWDLPCSKHTIPRGPAWTFGWDSPHWWYLSCPR